MSVSEPPIYDPTEPSGLARVALDGVGDLFGRVLAEMVSLPEHRPHVSHLEHQPLQDRVPPAGRGRHEPSGLLREVDQDGAGLEEGVVAGRDVHGTML